MYLCFLQSGTKLLDPKFNLPEMIVIVQQFDVVQYPETYQRK